MSALETGTWIVDAHCPRCGVTEPITVTIAAVLTETEDETATLRVKLKGKAIPHDCEQTRLILSINADPDGDELPEGDE